MLLFLCAALATFAITRIASGASAFPELASRAASESGASVADDVLLATRHVEIGRDDEDGTAPARFTIGVPTGWLEFREQREQEELGDESGTVMRFVSPDGSQLIAVQRSAGFLATSTAQKYLNAYRRELSQAVPNLVEARREELTGGMLDATFRTMEGTGPQGQLRRTTYLRLVPAGSDLWAVRVSVPTEREGTGRAELFEPVVAGFTPGA